jgi:hypothetical protein
MDGFGISEKTARLRLKGARGDIDPKRHPRVAGAARSATLRARVTDKRSSYEGREDKNLHASQGTSLASSRAEAVAPEGDDLLRRTEAADGRQLSSFFLPLVQLDPASVTLDRSCEQCDKTYTPQRSDGRFCSSACRQRAYRMRKRLRAPNKMSLVGLGGRSGSRRG